MTLVDANRLIRLVKQFIRTSLLDVPVDANADNGVGDLDIFGDAPVPVANQAPAAIDDDQFEKDCKYFIAVILPSIRQRVLQPDNSYVYEYYRGAASALDIDVFAFYREHSPNIPALDVGIRSALGHKAGLDAPERLFSKGGLVISARRTSLLPTRAEKLILSSVRYSGTKNKKASKPPKIPRMGEIERAPAIAGQGARVAREAIAAVDDAAGNRFMPAEPEEVFAEDYLGDNDEDEVEAAVDPFA